MTARAEAASDAPGEAAARVATEAGVAKPIKGSDIEARVEDVTQDKADAGALIEGGRMGRAAAAEDAQFVRVEANARAVAQATTKASAEQFLLVPGKIDAQVEAAGKAEVQARIEATAEAEIDSPTLEVTAEDGLSADTRVEAEMRALAQARTEHVLMAAAELEDAREIDLARAESEARIVAEKRARAMVMARVQRFAEARVPRPRPVDVHSNASEQVDGEPTPVMPDSWPPGVSTGGAASSFEAPVHTERRPVTPIEERAHRAPISPYERKSGSWSPSTSPDEPVPTSVPTTPTPPGTGPRGAQAAEGDAVKHVLTVQQAPALQGPLPTSAIMPTAPCEGQPQSGSSPSAVSDWEQVSSAPALKKPKLHWLGTQGSWAPDGEPKAHFQLPKFASDKASEFRKRKVADATRVNLVRQAILNFATHKSVVRRGLVSRQNRFEAAPRSSAAAPVQEATKVTSRDSERQRSKGPATIQKSPELAQR